MYYLQLLSSRKKMLGKKDLEGEAGVG